MMGRDYLWSMANPYYEFSVTYLGHGFEYVDTIEDYLQDTITVEADVTGLTCPQVMMACATSAAALRCV